MPLAYAYRSFYIRPSKWNQKGDTSTFLHLQVEVSEAKDFDPGDHWNYSSEDDDKDDSGESVYETEEEDDDEDED